MHQKLHNTKSLFWVDGFCFTLACVRFFVHALSSVLNVTRGPDRVKPGSEQSAPAGVDLLRKTNSFAIKLW